jgi:hypothetical protein
VSLYEALTRLPIQHNIMPNLVPFINKDPRLLAKYASLAGAMLVGAVGVYALLRPRRKRDDGEAGS